MRQPCWPVPVSNLEMATEIKKKKKCHWVELDGMLPLPQNPRMHARCSFIGLFVIAVNEWLIKVQPMNKWTQSASGKMHYEEIKIRLSQVGLAGRKINYCMTKRDNTFFLASFFFSRCGVPLPTHHWSVHSDLPGGSAGLPEYWGGHCEPPAAAGSLWERPAPMRRRLAPWPDCQVSQKTV